MNKNSVVNYVTNVIGLAIVGLAFYEYFDEKNRVWFITLIVIGMALLVFKNGTIQDILKAIIGVKKSNSNGAKSRIDSPNPKKEEK